MYVFSTLNYAELSRNSTEHFVQRQDIANDQTEDLVLSSDNPLLGSSDPLSDKENSAASVEDERLVTTRNFMAPRGLKSPAVDLPEDVIADLGNHFPPESKQSIVEQLRHHPSAQSGPHLRLMVRLLPRLPAHLEELMFAVGVDRPTLIDCIERFSPLLFTARLPDPVTSCFVGVDWPD